MTERLAKEIAKKQKKQREYVYIVHALSIWKCNARGERLAESKAFEATDDGWNKATKWMRKYSDDWWNVTLVKSRRD